MGRLKLRQLCVFVLACGVYFGALPHLYFVDLRGDGAGAFALGAALAWLLLAAVYVSWRQPTPLTVHGLCVALALPLTLANPDVTAPLGHSCWASSLISFPVSLALLALSAARGRRVDPLASRLAKGTLRPMPEAL